MPLILIDTDNAEWRERAEKKLQKQGFSEHQAFGAVTSILATGTPLDGAAVERAAEIQCCGKDGCLQPDACAIDTDRTRAAIEAAAKINSPPHE